MVWNIFETKTMKDYHDLYLKCDVLLFVDVFEKFRNNSLKNYGLCPSHYLSALFLIDIIISNRYSKASNKYLIYYDTKQESKHIYLDENNLYGYVVSKFLPTSSF